MEKKIIKQNLIAHKNTKTEKKKFIEKFNLIFFIYFELNPLLVYLWLNQVQTPLERIISITYLFIYVFHCLIHLG